MTALALAVAWRADVEGYRIVSLGFGGGAASLAVRGCRIAVDQLNKKRVRGETAFESEFRPYRKSTRAAAVGRFRSSKVDSRAPQG